MFSVPESTTTAGIYVEAIGQDEHGLVDGILVQLPLPDHVDAGCARSVPPDRDVDGFHPETFRSPFSRKASPIPCTAAGVRNASRCWR